MATTTNFGWETPDDTDLVKDGAAAIRTALGGVDTSFVDLKGGTTGQVLAKASNTDLDFVWSADAAGMTNPMTTTGDIIYSSSGSTPARLGIGTSGQVLNVNGSGVPAWTTISTAPTFVGCRAYVSSAQNANSGTLTYAAFTAENYDTNGFHDNVTDNSRFTVPTGKAGKYMITANGWIANPGVAAGNNRVTLYKNASTILTSAECVGQNYIPQILNLCDIQDLAVGDYIRLGIYQDHAANLSIANGTSGTYLAISYLGA